MSKVINISSNGIKQAIDDLINENELLQDKVYKQEDEIERLKKYMRDNLEVNEHNEYIIYIGTNEDNLSKIIGSDDNE